MPAKNIKSLNSHVIRVYAYFDRIYTVPRRDLTLLPTPFPPTKKYENRSGKFSLIDTRI